MNFVTLTQHNPLIDWINELIKFCPSLQENLASSHVIANTQLASSSSPDTSLQLLNSMNSISISETSVFTSEQPNTAIIDAVEFLCTLKLPSSSKFQLCLCSLNIQANSTKLVETPDLSNVYSKYHEFTNIFSKTKAEVLSPHCPYDIQINLKEGAQPPVGPIYSLQYLNKRL